MAFYSWKNVLNFQKYYTKDNYDFLKNIKNIPLTNYDEKCQEIVRNANNFMKQFEDIEVEIKIFNMIKEHYKNTFTLA